MFFYVDYTNGLGLRVIKLSLSASVLAQAYNSFLSHFLLATAVDLTVQIDVQLAAVTHPKVSSF